MHLTSQVNLRAATLLSVMISLVLILDPMKGTMSLRTPTAITAGIVNLSYANGSSVVEVRRGSIIEIKVRVKNMGVETRTFYVGASIIGENETIWKDLPGWGKTPFADPDEVIAYEFDDYRMPSDAAVGYHGILVKVWADSTKNTQLAERWFPRSILVQGSPGYVVLTFDFESDDELEMAEGHISDGALNTMRDILNLLHGSKISATIFVQGACLTNPRSGSSFRAIINQAALDGFEIASHSYSHPSDMSSLDELDIEREITSTGNIIEEVIGKEPIGFRAPRFAYGDRLWRVLAGKGYIYDSSVWYDEHHPQPDCSPYLLDDLIEVPLREADVTAEDNWQKPLSHWTSIMDESTKGYVVVLDFHAQFVKDNWEKFSMVMNYVVSLKNEGKIKTACISQLGEISEAIGEKHNKKLVIRSATITNEEGCFIVGAKEEMIVSLEDENGNPVTGAHVTMEIEHWRSRVFDYVEIGNGVYCFSEDQLGYDVTNVLEIYTIDIFAAKDDYLSHHLTKEVPSLVPSVFTIMPVRGWSVDPRSFFFVKVGNEFFAAFSVTEDPVRMESGIASHAWLIVNRQGELITDADLFKKASLTAEVAFMTDGPKSESLANALRARTDYWRSLPTYVVIGEATAKIRDICSEMLGIIASFSTAMPVSIVRLSNTATYKTIVAVLNTAIDTAKTGADAYRYAEIAAAFVFLEDAANKAAHVSDILDRIEGLWTYDLAEVFYSNYRESLLTGTESMVLCTEALPSADTYSQIVSIMTNFASGLLPIEVAVTDLVELDEPLRKAIEVRENFSSLFGPIDSAFTDSATKVRQSFSGGNKIANVGWLFKEADAIETGCIGGSITIVSSSESGEIVTKSANVSPEVGIDTESDYGRVVVSVTSTTSEGKTIIVNIEDRVMTTSDLRQVLVLYDGEEIGLADDYDDVLDPDDDLPEYLVTIGARGVQVLVSIPYFSTHTIEISRLELVEVSVTGLPPNIHADVFLDGKLAGQIDCNETLCFNFETDTNHLVTVEQCVFEESDIRYVCLPNTLEVTSSMEIEFRYVEQYSLRVSSPYGRPRGEGWYDAGSTAEIGIEDSIPMEGLAGILGAKLAFSRWSGDIDSDSPTLTIIMNEPKRVAAMWGADYAMIHLEVAVAVASLVVVLFILLRRRIH